MYKKNTKEQDAKLQALIDEVNSFGYGIYFIYGGNGWLYSIHHEKVSELKLRHQDISTYQMFFKNTGAWVGSGGELTVLPSDKFYPILTHPIVRTHEYSVLKPQLDRFVNHRLRMLI